MVEIEQKFVLRDLTDSPSAYLGNDLCKLGGKFHISSYKYIQEVIRKYEKDYQPLRKESVPARKDVHLELDETPLLKEKGIREYQHIVGVGQWLIVAGRLDINYAVSSLSRFSSAPREGHLKEARRVFGYLKRFKKRGYIINPSPPQIDQEYQNVEVKIDFGNQYSYFIEEIDPRFPEPLLEELTLNLFVDADHCHDRVTGRSITGLLSMVGSTPVTWRSSRQLSVQTATFTAEFTALKTAVEEAVSLRYHLRSMGVKVSKPTAIWCDNMGVIINATKPESLLNKKVVALAYHFVREHQANDVVSIRKIDTTDNYADPFTKALTSNEFHGFFDNLLCNAKDEQPVNDTKK